MPRLRRRRLLRALQEAEQLHREGQHQRGVLLRRDGDHGLQQPQLERRGLGAGISPAACAGFFEAWSSASALITPNPVGGAPDACPPRGGQGGQRQHVFATYRIAGRAPDEQTRTRPCP
ncbi:hypothetical protein [Streptomyces sp. VB1]|uniref:hypothetical protein n=1 Tax=Streptomyces sp. VB1 TaxID=2986803 RepID=UPI00224285FE|nr:hypothetical protein [Streptomyces sp. VB1]UZI31933.1 hypothetical protein OH133_29710 [Streptomyces sp. VB1]